MGYNKPITARIQHSTNKGMKIQEPLLDIGSAAKQVDYDADSSLMSGAENSKFVDIRSSMPGGTGPDNTRNPKNSSGDPKSSEDEDKSPKAPVKFNSTLQDKADKGELNPGFTAAIKADQDKKGPKAAVKSLGPKGIGKSYMPKAMAKNNDYSK